MNLHVTRTYTTCDIVIQHYNEHYRIYAQDFSFETRNNNQDVEIHPLVRTHLDDEYLRVFESMKTFTEWLFEIGAVVDNCWFV